MKKILVAWLSVLLLCTGIWTLPTEAADTVCRVVITLNNGKYGMTADGAAVELTAYEQGNASAVIQKALNYAKTIEEQGYSGIEVTVPAGVHSINNLVVYSNTTLHAVGATFQAAGSGTMIHSAAPSDLSPSERNAGYDMTKNVIIDGGIFDAKGAVGQGIRFTHGSHIKIQNVTVQNLQTGHMITLEGVKDAEVTGCTLKTFYEWANSPKEAIHLDIVHNEIMNPGAEVFDDLPCVNVKIADNTITDTPSAIGSHSMVDGVFHKNIQILNNTVNNMSSVALRIYNYKDVLIQGNKITGANVGIKVYTYANPAQNDEAADDVDESDGLTYYEPLPGTVKEDKPADGDYGLTINNNTIKKMSGSIGHGIQLRGNEERPVSNVKVTNNTVNDVSNRGIYVNAECSKTSITGNTVKNTKDSGIYISNRCTGSDISKNTISGAGEKAIYVTTSCGQAKISENTITSSTHESIRIADKCSDMVISKNNITGGEDGIVAYDGCDGVSMTDNTISKPKGNGILLSKNCKNAVVKKNKVVTPTQHGISLFTEVTDARIEDNTVSTPNNSGVCVNQDSTGAVITGNKITKSKGDGIYVTVNSNDAAITNNTVSEAGSSAIYVRDNSKHPVITGNVISDNKKYGIYVLSKCDNAVISENTLTASKDTGIYVSGNSTGARIDKNTITAPAKFGIGLYDGSQNAEVKANVIDAPGSHGINITNQSGLAAVTANKITKAGGHGIYIAVGSDACSLSGNTITSAKKNGVYLNVVKKTAVKDNKVTKSKSNGVYVYKSNHTNVTGNKVQTAKIGIYLVSADNCTISKNTVDKTSGSGIKLYNGCDKNKIQTNVLKDMKNSGIDLSTKCNSNKIVNNSVSKSGKYGIAIDKKCNSVTIDKNKIDIADCGIKVGSSNQTKVTNNTIKGSFKRAPIYVAGGSKNNIKASIPLPEMNTITKKTKVIKGTVLPKTTLKVKIGSKTYTCKVNGKGKFTSAKIPKQKTNTKITIYYTVTGKNQYIITEKVK